MRMTIEELVETAQKYSCMIVTKDMWNTALGSVNKLQKIERILNWREYDVDPNYHTNEDMIDEIREVIEDGNEK